MSANDLHTIPARRGRAVRLGKGQSIRIINTHGQQVVDTWCFNADDLREFLSMEHLRPTIDRIFPHAGDRLVSNRRRPKCSPSGFRTSVRPSLAMSSRSPGPKRMTCSAYRSPPAPSGSPPASAPVGEPPRGR